MSSQRLPGPMGMRSRIVSNLEEVQIDGKYVVPNVDRMKALLEDRLPGHTFEIETLIDFTRYLNSTGWYPRCAYTQSDGWAYRREVEEFVQWLTSIVDQ